MSVPFSNTKLRVPQGFHTLLESLTREVLRKKPANIYDFAATYFENLLKDKKQGKLDEVVKQSLLDDRFYNNNSFKESPPVNDSKNDEAATKIQSSFRSHQVRDDLEKSKASEAAPIKNSPQEPPKVEHESHLKEAILSESAVVKHEEDLNDAAVRIQSTFRGYMTRKNLEGKETSDENNNAGNQSQAVTDNKNDSKSKEELDAAAVKIQATFRGYQTRRELSGKK